jgi:hypothetical protein
MLFGAREGQEEAHISSCWQNIGNEISNVTSENTSTKNPSEGDRMREGGKKCRKEGEVSEKTEVPSKKVNK